MDVMLLEIFIEVSPLQLPNALPLIDVTPFGIVTEVNSVQLEKAPHPIDVIVYVLPLYKTDSGITTSPAYFPEDLGFTSTVDEDVGLYVNPSTSKS